MPEAARACAEDRLHQRARHLHTLGDEIELAPSALFGEHAYALSMSSTKSRSDICFGAAGVSRRSLDPRIRDGVVPPTLNLDNPSQSCDIDLVPKQSKERSVRYGLPSFGFGGPTRR